jgi:hypothetical protein
MTDDEWVKRSGEHGGDLNFSKDGLLLKHSSFVIRHSRRTAIRPGDVFRRE